jgi:hypothetical protein
MSIIIVIWRSRTGRPAVLFLSPSRCCTTPPIALCNPQVCKRGLLLQLVGGSECKLTN